MCSPDRGAGGTILSARSRHHSWRGRGSLSIKSFSGGRALYQTSEGYFSVGDGEYLLLNCGQEYSISVDKATPVESFCVFFDPDLVETVHASMTMPSSRLLDNPDVQTTRSFHVVERTYPHDDVISPALLRLRSMHARHADDVAWLQEELHDMLIRLVCKQTAVLAEIEQVPALRAATREELYRRLHLAREYAAAFFDQSITLSDLAQVAGLSTNHLLRTFRSLFGQTPYQYLVGLRIDRARKLLETSGTPVTEICFAVGWKSLGSFNVLFHRHTGMSPSEYRRQNGDIQEASQDARSR